MRRAVAALALLLGFGAPGAQPAFADHAPVYVRPAIRGVPVVINRQDASWAVVEGDWGLSRPGHVSPTIIPGHPVFIRPLPGAYYPQTGRSPRLGRLEIEPPPDRRLPRPAQSYVRSWTTQSPRVPASVTPQYDLRDLPPVTIEPRQPRPRRPVPCQPGLYC
jgi:hypothetical protein